MVEAINFKKLHEQYKSADSPGPDMQIKWLLRQGFSGNVVDQAMLTVYDKIQRGEIKFEGTGEHTAGWYLDQYLRSTAQSIYQTELDSYIKRLEAFDEERKKKWAEAEAKTKEQTKPWYKRIFG